MTFLPLSDNAARHSIDAATLWSEYLSAKAAAQLYAGGMYWKKEGEYQYLVKTLAGKQSRMGRRSVETERAFEAFHAKKHSSEARLKSLTQALGEAQRQNKALRVGRVPDIAVRVLNALADGGLARHFRVIGTHALYAYESYSGVRISVVALDTHDVDIFTDARKRVEFVSDISQDAVHVLALLQRADPSFQGHGETLKYESYINDKGFEVKFLRPNTEEVNSPAIQLPDNDGALGSATTCWTALLTQSPMFSQIIISATGRIATMHTIDPQTFVDFKRSMSTLKNRESIKRKQDAQQADMVQAMLAKRMLTSALV